MHPAIRIVLLAVLAVLLPRLSPVELGGLCGALAVAALALRQDIARPLWRMRWLFAVLLALALGFTPGDPAWAALPGLTLDGLLQGTRQASLLATLIVAVQLLIAPLPPDEVASGLCWLLRPLAGIGFEPDRFARRLGHALAGLARAGADLRTLGPGSSGIDAAARALARVEAEAAVATLGARLPVRPGPRWFEWIAPAGLAGLAALA